MSHTILDLAHAGLEVVEREVAHFVLEAVEIHLGRGLSGGWWALRKRWCGRRTVRSVLWCFPRGSRWPWQVLPGLEGLETPELAANSEGLEHAHAASDGGEQFSGRPLRLCEPRSQVIRLWVSGSRLKVAFSRSQRRSAGPWVPDRRSRHRTLAAPGRHQSLDSARDFSSDHSSRAVSNGAASASCGQPADALAWSVLGKRKADVT